MGRLCVDTWFHGLWTVTETDDYPPLSTLPFSFGRRTLELEAIQNKNSISMLSFQIVVDHVTKFEQSRSDVATSGCWNGI